MRERRGRGLLWGHVSKWNRLSKGMWLLLGLLALLPGMAYMQYRWIGQVSDAARERAKTRLENSVEQLVTEFDAEVTRAHLAFWMMPGAGPEQDAFERFAARYHEWTRLAPYPQLIREAHVIDTTREPWTVSRIDSAGAITPVAGWAELDKIRSRIGEAGEGGPAGFRRRSADFIIGGAPAFLVALRAPRPEESNRREQFQQWRESGPGRRRGEQSREAGDRRRGPWERMAWSRTVGWAVISFDAEYMGREFLPELTRRAFQQGQNGEESEYELRVELVSDPERAIFVSSPAAGHAEFSTPDASAGLFAMRPDCFVPSGAAAQGGSAGMAGLFSERASSDGGALDRTKEILTRKPSPCGSAARALGNDGGRWKLLVKHRAGSLDSAFATFRLRTLVISFGVLLVLGLGVTMLTVSTERARSLARLQMEFAMGVSHELRTPLTVIRVAADNLANGMMANAQHAKKYGQVIGDEARRLTDMVEQILTFARSQSSAHAAEAAPVAPEQIVRRALAARSQALRDAGMEVERFIEPDLPTVLVDENAIVDCVQNLIDNAMKYAAGGGWIRVRVENAPQPGGSCIRISVEDRGPGIAPDDLPHIFDPFFRGEAVRNSQLPGVGLGLSLVRRIVEAHNGTINVKSTADAGTTFFIDLPAMKAAPVPAPEIKEVAPELAHPSGRRRK